MKNFFQSFFRKKPDSAKIAALYGVIMAQSRARGLFERYGLSDDFETRFESLTLHMFLLQRRLGRDAREVKQALMDFMVSDLDRTLREMGVGDVGVVKRMKHFMEGFYGRVRAYENALTHTDTKEILRALDRNLYAASSTDIAKLEQMRDYIARQMAVLQAQAIADIENGQLFFSPVEG